MEMGFCNMIFCLGFILLVNLGGVVECVYWMEVL